MKELSLHILDIVENSIRAEATRIEIYIQELVDNNIFRMIIEDNGKGMSEEFLNNVRNPFHTTRTTRKVGLGIPLLDAACQRCDGKLQIDSQLGKGTKIIAQMKYDHIDRAPIGDMVSTMITILLSNPTIHIIYSHTYNLHNFSIDTDEIKDILDGVEITEPSVMIWIREYIEKNLIEIRQS